MIKCIYVSDSNNNNDQMIIRDERSMNSSLNIHKASAGKKNVAHY